ncbi:MAG: RNA 2',3'-cyclic phosphodiesterase, partial [Candidatus Methanofastidiosia archaeon]
EIEDELKDRILKIQNELKFEKMKIVKPQNLHVTLKFLGEIDEEKTEKVLEVLRDTSKEFSPFKASLKKLGVFRNLNYIRVLWIGIDNEMEELQKRIDERLSLLGFKREKKIMPHLTLARVKYLKDKKAFLERFRELENVEVGEVEVKSVKLKKSILTSKGPIYSDVEEVLL